jgi:hypothetical protein
MMDNVHPKITFRITGYRSICYPERRSDGRYGRHEANHHIFPEGAFEDVKRAFPIGSEHAHLPPAPCRFEMVFAGPRDMLEERRQLYCRTCYPPVIAVDRKVSAA